MSSKINWKRGVTAGWGATGDNWALMLGRSYKRNTKPMIVWLPGHAQGAASVLASAVAPVWCEWGYPVISLDFGSACTFGGTDGVNKWTSDVAVNAFTTIRDTIAPAVGALPGLGISAGSAGAALGAYWAYHHPNDVFGCLFFIGGIDLEDVRANNRLPPATATITNALGAPVPDARNPRKLATTWPDEVPIRHYYAGNDTICLPQITRDFCQEVTDGGGNAQAIQYNDGNHDFYTNMPVQEAAGWLIKQA